MTAKTANPGCQTGLIRALLARKCAPSTILEKAKKPVGCLRGSYMNDG